MSPLVIAKHRGDENHLHVRIRGEKAFKQVGDSRPVFFGIAIADIIHAAGDDDQLRLESDQLVEVFQAAVENASRMAARGK